MARRSLAACCTVPLLAEPPPADGEGGDATAGTEAQPSGSAAHDATTAPSPGVDDPGPAAPPRNGAAPAAQDRPRSTSPVESIVSPGTPEREARGGQAATLVPETDGMNAVPTADVGPRVIVNTVGLDDDGDGDADASPDTDPSALPVPGNGLDAVSDSGGDALHIPAFLRRS